MAVSVSINFGWWHITVVVVVFVMIWFVVSWNIVYPWDRVIDDNTTEVARWEAWR